MKKNLFFTTILCGGLAIAQNTGKVGIQTKTPTETLDVNGTVRVQTLPQDGDKSSINTPNANSDFKATKTVVVDDNGVLGYVQGVPVTKLPKVKTINYVTSTTLIDNDTPDKSRISLGHLQVRYNGIDPTAGATQPISFQLIEDIKDIDGNKTNVDNVICNVTKVGHGGAGFGGQKTFYSAKTNTWYDITKSKSGAIDNDLIPNLEYNDFAIFNIALLNTKEVYRLTVSLNSPITEKNKNQNFFVQSPAQVTLFLERLTNDE